MKPLFNKNRKKPTNKKSIELILSGEDNVEKLMNELYLVSYEGGFVNGGTHQLDRPNTFIVPQGRCAEFLLFSTISKILRERDSSKAYYIPNNGHFDTTEANITQSGLHAVNLFDKNTILEKFPVEKLTITSFFGSPLFSNSISSLNISELKLCSVKE